MTKKVERVSIGELQKARQTANSTGVKMPDSSHAQNPTNSSAFIKNISDTSIREAFKPFGFIYMDRISHNDGKGHFIYVVCNHFEATFDDYNFHIDFVPNNSIYTDKHNFYGEEIDNSFDLNAFSKYCEKLNIAPDHMIEETIILNLFKGSAYPEARRSFKMKEAKKAYAELPKNMQKLFKGAHEKVENGINSTFNKQRYGNHNIEEMLSVQLKYDNND